MKTYPKSELTLNSNNQVYHLGLSPDDISNKIILVGDQDRVGLVSSLFDQITHKSQHREFVCHTGTYKGKKITYHDPCYLGRANKVYEAPRELIKKLSADLVEMKSCKSKALCCGAGGAQMFKDAEKGKKEINIERTEQALEVKPEIIAAACPFCNTMMSDGIKNKEVDQKIKLYDVAELIANSKDL